MAQRNGKKVFKDPIHGTIKLHPLLVAVIDTPQFQRLRNIRQMGGKYFVYPGVSHNRFEHSIGVGYLAGEFLETLKENQPDLNITARDILCVQIAGLCHDLGHGPFSHVFDSKVAPKMGAHGWKHEDASALMFQYMLQQSDRLMKMCKENGLKVSPEDGEDGEDGETDLVFIKELILGCPIGKQHSDECPTSFQYKGRPKEKWFLYEIVNNTFTGIDVDKWDYFARDCHGLGLSYDFDWKQYICGCQVLEAKDKIKRKTICAKDKEVTSLYDMFHAREMLHRKALQLETCVSIELMLSDALVESCVYLEKNMGMKIRQALISATESVSTTQVHEAMSVYEQLNDSVLQTVLMLEKRKNGLEKLPVNHIWERIQRRNLYHMVGHVTDTQITEGTDIKDLKKGLEDHLKDCNKNWDCPKSFEVFVAKYNYGRDDKNPLDLLMVHRNNKEVIRLAQEEQSKMLPREFEEKHIRLYCKSTKREEIEDMTKEFERWCQNNKLITARRNSVAVGMNHSPELGQEK